MWSLQANIGREIRSMHYNTLENFNAVDNEGNTALSYCQSKEMYNILRENGAPFQFDVWMRIYQTELAIASLVTVGTAVCLNQKEILTAETVSAFAQDTYAACALLAADMKNKAEFIYNADAQTQSEMMSAATKSLKAGVMNVGGYVMDATVKTGVGLLTLNVLADLLSLPGFLYWVFVSGDLAR